MPYLTPLGDVPTGLQCRPVFIPSGTEFLALVTGALSELTKPQNWQQSAGGLDVETVTQVFEAMLDAYLLDQCEQPPPDLTGSLLLFHQNSVAESGGPLVTIPVPNTFPGYEALVQPFGTMTYIDLPSGNDVFSQTFDLPAGTFSFWVLGITESANGIIQWEIDSISQGAQDWYSPTPTANILREIATLTFATPGTHVLRGTINSQNPLSGGQYHALTAFLVLPG